MLQSILGDYGQGMSSAGMSPQAPARAPAPPPPPPPPPQDMAFAGPPGAETATPPPPSFPGGTPPMPTPRPGYGMEQALTPQQAGDSTISGDMAARPQGMRLPVTPGTGVAPPPPGATPGPAPGAFVGPTQPQQQGGVGAWLSNVFGGNDPRKSAQIAGSLGAGLKSVGDNWNKPGLAALAGSAGSAIEGGTKGDQTYTEQMSKAAARATAAKAAGDLGEYRKAMADYHMERLKAAQKVGTVSSRNEAYQKSEEGKLHIADSDINKEVETMRKRLDNQMKAAIASGDQEKVKELDGRIEETEAKSRERIYRERGLTPDKIEKIRTRGQSPENPHEPTTQDEFNASVKPGQWFKNPKDGKVMKRKTDVPQPADAPGGVLSQTPPSMPDVRGHVDDSAELEPA